MRDRCAMPVGSHLHSPAQGNSHKEVLKPDATVHLQPTHLDTTLKVYLEFAEYLNKTFGVTF
ncbi:uncharacterized protein M421DRAFT_160850 [Didymella exigua CBS 183.55]|uniref:Uncharacterized protein n=1 Tax=Didymella exigua CBS 183.55 TaxID=1150837 RepID=A0A6A5RKX1_9PLEO|nr:uncharacterized protein M421DRAFT_160850 [Didymella exigua CBS 183.55]KAF1928442.1 hypothetical protein M421DRAFT_160850 [Didymella exigua CBS 183.55]